MTCLLIAGLDVELRRRYERKLINLYRDALGSHGVVNVPTEDEAYRLYRQCAAGGLVNGWLICPPQNYGEIIAAANISELVTAVVDFDSLASLDECARRDLSLCAHAPVRTCFNAGSFGGLRVQAVPGRHLA